MAQKNLQKINKQNINQKWNKVYWNSEIKKKRDFFMILKTEFQVHELDYSHHSSGMKVSNLHCTLFSLYSPWS